MVTKPTQQDIDALAARRMREAGVTEPAPDTWDAEFRRKQFEERKEAITQNAKLHLERIYQLDTEREAAQRARTEEDQAELEGELRRRYTDAMPGDVSDEQWALVRESVMHRHRLSQMGQFDEQVAAARRSPSYRI